MADFTVCEAEQRSSDWHRSRLGRLTASCAKDMLATIKSGEAAARRDLRMKLVLERLTGRSDDDGYVNADMRRGMELEPDALLAYEAVSGRFTNPCGFIARNDIQIGCSPDAVIGDLPSILGGVEAKAPRPANHLRYIREGVVPPEHVPQMVHSLWVTGAQFWDFVSYCDQFPPAVRCFVARLDRDERAIAEYERKARAFLAEIDVELQALQTLIAMKERAAA